MTRYGPMFGPDITFLGVDRCDWDEPATYATPTSSYSVRRSTVAPRTDRAPASARRRSAQTDYLPHDGSRPSLALRVDAPARPAGRTTQAMSRCSPATRRVGARPRGRGAHGREYGRDPGDPRRRPHVTWPDAAGVAQHVGWGRVSMVHFDAHADTGDIEFGSLIGHGQPMRRLIESGAVRGDRFLQVGLRGYWPPPDDARLDGRAAACAPTR